MKFVPRLLCSLSGVSLLFAALAAHPAPIPGIFNTGIGANGVALAAGQSDPHYILTVAAQGTVNSGAIVMVNNAAWLANDAASAWIGVVSSGAANVAVGNYYFRTTFDLTGLDPDTARLTFQVSVDNDMADVLLNGVPTGASFSGFSAFSDPVTLTTGFLPGTNTLEFRTVNGGTAVNPGGFRALVSGTAEFLPPPGTPPSFVSHPTNQTVISGDGTVFTTSVYASRPVFYQWRFNSNPIPDATNSSYIVGSASLNSAGSYDVVVNNAFGTATSQSAVLTVLAPPNLSPAQLTYEPLGPSSRRTGLSFSEIMYHPTNRTDGRNVEFVEIYNSNPFFEDISGWRLSGEMDFTFPSNTVIQGNSFLVVATVPADVQAVYGISGVLGGSTNNLSNEGGTLRLRKRSGGIVLDMQYSDLPPWPAAADGTGHSLVLARPSFGENNPQAWAASATKGGSPGSADPVPTGPLENVVINEILANTDLPLSDYVELHNHSQFTVDLSGCWLSDSPTTNKYRIINGTTLQPGAFVSFDQGQLGFALAGDGETVYLVNPAQTRVIDAVRYSGQASGVSFGRHPDGASTFRELGARTPGGTNAAPLARSIVINEIMFNSISGDSDDEYIELHNRGALSVNIGGWRFISGIDFEFPPNTTIASKGYLVVARDTLRLQTNYPGLNSANLIGNYNGNLANGGERVALAMPEYSYTTNGSTITTNAFYVVVNEVTYSDGGRWGRWADGGGSSLELIDPDSDNRLGANWADSDETGKSSWTVVEHTGTADLGSGTANQLQMILLDAGEALVDNVEVIYQGVNRVPNSDFEAGVTGWFFQGTHSKTTLETSGGFNSARSLHLRASDRGDLGANRLRAPLSIAIPAASQNVTLRARVRWLRGHPETLLRLKGNYLEAFGRLPVPTNLGTPGAANSQAAANLGPAITEVGHRPVLPAAFQSIRVTARVTDPDGVQSVALKYRIDPATALSSIAMVDNGQGADAVAQDGIFTGVIPGQAAGRVVAFHVEAADRVTTPATSLFPNDAPNRECLVRVGEIQPDGAFGTYRLWMTASTVNTWATRERLSNENLDGTFVYGTNRVIYNVGGHYSGSSYTSPGYNSPVGALCGYDIAFPDDDPFLSTTHMVLDWPVRDNTDQREQLMFWLLEQYGLPNMYRRYVIMYVNGVRRGQIYDDVQQPGSETVEEWFSDDPEGTLLKTDCWDEFNDAGDRETGCLDLNSLELYTTTGGVKKTARYRWTWRPRAIQGTANDFSDLFNLVDAANAPAAGFQSAMESLADMEHWMRTFAMNDLASFWDAFGNPNAKNTYLYKPTQGTWKLMSWDFDVGLGVFNDPVNDPLFPSLNDTQMNRVYATPAFVRLYWGALAEGVNTFFQTGAGTPIDAILNAKFAAFQANGISVTDPAAIKSWISQRRAFLLTQLNSVAATFNVNGTNNFSTNRNLITLTGTSPVTVYTITVNGVAYTPVWTTATAWRLQIPVVAGTNVLEIAGLDRFGRPVSGTSRTVTVNYTGTDELPQDNIVINEVMYNPLVSDATYVELFNISTTHSFDLSGWRLNGVDFTFPPGTVITNRGFIVVCKDPGAFGNAYGFATPILGNFDGQLDNGGETITLLAPGATSAEDVVVDRVTYDDDPPWPTMADGFGTSLQLVDATQDNNRVSNWSDQADWRFFSFTGAAGPNPTNLLIYLQLAGELYIDDVSLVAGPIPATGPNLLQNSGFESGLTPWRVSGNHTNSVVTTGVARSGTSSMRIISTGVGGSGGSLAQTVSGLTAADTYTFGFWFRPSTNGSGVNFRLSTSFRNLTPIDYKPVSFTPGLPNSVLSPLPPYPLLWFSEIQPQNVNTIADNFGEHEPWIEIYNADTVPLNLDNYYLANSYSNLTQWKFPAGTVIAPGQYLLIWADAEPGETASFSPAGGSPIIQLHTNFRLNPTNGSVALSRDLGGLPQIVDYLNYSGVGTNRSYGAYPPGQSSYRQIFYFPTPRGTNNPAAPLVTLLINEWMAANTAFLRDPMDQDFDDWFEIYNPTTNRVDLTGFSLTDDFADTDKSPIPAGITVPPLGYLLVWADEEQSQTRTNGDLHVGFRLGQDGERIGLYDPAGRQVDAVVFGRQTNNISQGRWPNGGPEPYVYMRTPTPRAANVVPSINPTVISFTLGPGNAVTLVWSAEAGRSYRVQYKDNLNTAEWTTLGNDVDAVGATASKVDQNNGQQRFYRVMLVQ